MDGSAWTDASVFDCLKRQKFVMSHVPRNCDQSPVEKVSAAKARKPRIIVGNRNIFRHFSDAPNEGECSGRQGQTGRKKDRGSEERR